MAVYGVEGVGHVRHGVHAAEGRPAADVVSARLPPRLHLLQLVALRHVRPRRRRSVDS